MNQKQILNVEELTCTKHIPSPFSGAEEYYFHNNKNNNLLKISPEGVIYYDPKDNYRFALPIKLIVGLSRIFSGSNQIQEPQLENVKLTNLNPIKRDSINQILSQKNLSTTGQRIKLINFFWSNQKYAFSVSQLSRKMNFHSNLIRDNIKKFKLAGMIEGYLFNPSRIYYKLTDKFKQILQKHVK